MKAKVELDHPSSSISNFPECLEASCKEILKKNDEVMIFLSPPHPLQTKPWELIFSMIIFMIGLFSGKFLLGFVVSLMILTVPFFKGHRSHFSYLPLAIKIT
ncbi:MAG: hypothetical protein HYS07_03145 [Chlamydiae bacterium]|nr:hypothetical protein [Chlamydiota bacterium]